MLENAERLFTASLGCQPPRAFWNHERSNQEKDRWNRGHRKHPAPSPLAIPRQQDLLRRSPQGHWAGNEPVHNLRQENTEDEGPPAEREQTASQPRKPDLCDIHRREA